MIGGEIVESNTRMIEKLTNFVRWIFSNTVWTILTYIVPFSFLIPLAKDIWESIVNRTFTLTINFLQLFGVVFFVIIEATLVLININIRLNSKTGDKNCDNHNEDMIFTQYNYECDNRNKQEQQYKEQDYYFEEYHKHLTVYRNGNGIIINSFILIVNDINAISKFKRELRIHDSKITTEFPKLKDMKRTRLSNRFSSFGFWCKCINNKNLISSVEEKYWTDDDDDSDNTTRLDKKALKWILKMNPSSIEIGKPYKIVYIFSIPGMFPINNGKFSEDEASIKGTNGKFKSQFAVKHKIKKFIYTVSFENGLDLYKNPMGTIKVSGKENNLHFTNDNNIIYDKYIFNIDDPECQSVINIEWKFKTKFKKKTGGRENGTNQRN